MPTTLTAKFDTRREAEMTIERLVQEYGFERTDIFVTPDGGENTAGTVEAGSDIEHPDRSPEPREDAALQGAIKVSVDIEDDARAADVRAAFEEFDASETSSD